MIVSRLMSVGHLGDGNLLSEIFALCELAHKLDWWEW